MNIESPRTPAKPTRSKALLDRLSSRQALYIFLVAFLIFTFYFGLGNYPILDNDEGLYAQIAREMVHSGRLVIPTLNGVPYIEKPPLLYWLTALCYRTLGRSEFTTRLVPATAGLLTVLALIQWYPGRRSKGEPLLAGAILGSTVGFIIFSRVLIFDVLLTLFLTIALLLYREAWRSGRTAPMRAACAALGLAVMSKGLVAIVLFGLTVAVTSLSGAKDERAFPPFPDPVGLLLFALIAFPWHLAASFEQAGFAKFYFINEHVMRFFGLRIPDDYYTGGPFYYVPLLLVYLLPWSFFLPLLFTKLPHQEPALAPFDARFVGSWFLVIFGFFSVAVEKGNTYIVVAIPPIAILLANQITAAWGEPRARSRLMWGTALGTAAVPVAWIVARVLTSVHQFQREYGLRPPSLGCGLAALAVFCASLALLRRGRRSIGIPVACLLATTAFANWVGVGLVRSTANVLSQAGLVRRSRARATCGSYYFYRDYERISSAAFYLPLVIPVIDSASSDLWFGEHAQPDDSVFLSVDAFERGTRDPKACVVVRRKWLPEFSKRFDGFRAIASNPMNVMMASTGTIPWIHPWLPRAGPAIAENGGPRQGSGLSARR